MPRIDNELLYANAIKQYGESARGVCWFSDLHQLVRFETIRSFLPDDLASQSIVDAGCGFGDFYHFLQNNNIKIKSYIGIDIHKEMCKIATKNIDMSILHRDITRESLPMADYYVCSGALNILTPFETVQFIQNCYKASTRAFIFNVLHGKEKSETYNYLSTQEIQKIANELQVKEISFSSDYLENDITVRFSR